MRLCSSVIFGRGVKYVSQRLVGLQSNLLPGAASDADHGPLQRSSNLMSIKNMDHGMATEAEVCNCIGTSWEHFNSDLPLIKCIKPLEITQHCADHLVAVLRLQ